MSLSGLSPIQKMIMKNIYEIKLMRPLMMDMDVNDILLIAIDSLKRDVQEINERCR